MSGTLLNCATIIIGSLLGIWIGDRLSLKIRESIMVAIGLVTIVVGLQNALKTGNILIPLIGLVSGTIIGELLDLDAALKRFGTWLQGKVNRGDTSISADSAENLESRARFINGFVTASLVFCIGPMTILGSVQNGINGTDIQLLAIKATLDLFTSMTFAASLGIGVAFSALPTIVVQGSFSLLGALLAGAIAAGTLVLDANNPYIRELTAVGGLMLLGLSLVLLNLKQVRAANFLPGLIVTPLLILLAAILHISIYPSL